MYVYELERLEHLSNWLTLKNEVLRPIADDSGNGHWGALKHGDVVPFDLDLRPDMSPKGLFFAERETVMTFDGEMFRETLPEQKSQVLFGLKACDLTAIAYQDKHFKDDPYYQARRKHTLLIGIDCQEACENGFCASVDAGPHVDTNIADLVITPMPHIGDDDHGWWIICSSPEGQAAIAGMGLTPADQGWEHWRTMARSHAEASFPKDTHIINGIQRINGRAVPDEAWERFAHQCISCSGCSMMCPTCSCYATRDVPEDDGIIARERIWDSCLMVGFQKEASGANPASEAGKRVYRYWYHKFSDDVAARAGRYMCVGCGRCEATCPGMIGVHSIMEKIAHA